MMVKSKNAAGEVTSQIQVNKKPIIYLVFQLRNESLLYVLYV